MPQRFRKALSNRPGEAGTDRKEREKHLESWLKNCLIPAMVSEYLSQCGLVSRRETVTDCPGHSDFEQVQRAIQ